MKCPHCDIELLLGEKTGIEIDYCPKCRGIWLDRGELEKIIERANEYFSQAKQPGYRSDSHHNDDYYEDRKHHDKDEHHYGSDHNDMRNHGYKKKSFLGDLFDF